MPHINLSFSAIGNVIGLFRHTNHIGNKFAVAIFHTLRIGMEHKFSGAPTRQSGRRNKANSILIACTSIAKASKTKVLCNDTTPVFVASKHISRRYRSQFVGYLFCVCNIFLVSIAFCISHIIIVINRQFGIRTKVIVLCNVA